ncbi:CLUMA_CG005728, isoform A [Clunio marinus]|uniref:Alkaline phosphatase n=1 Tax=Clunio marinus TaxID=568069 RepID=A0A1J1HVN4_9DIPT|nr:CLUMA_CG005728, isoform A [Clunio marinus]
MKLKFLVFSLFLVKFQVVHGQNDNERDIEWNENDPRWEKKVPNWWDEDNFVPPVGPDEEKSKGFWNNRGQNILKSKLEKKINENTARNVVIFIGDGMGLSTLMATRSYIGDVNRELSFEKFHHTGLAKTYCINYQVPDSACTATAILTGVKNNYGTIGVDGNVKLRDCSAQQDKDSHLSSILKHAQDAGKSTGIVTTTRITHATPAAGYAKTSSRYWESNEFGSEGCDDVALQLIHGDVGSKLDVAMGGGRRHFLSNTNGGGLRTDNRNLIEEFLIAKKEIGKNPQVVQNRSELMNIKAVSTDSILGLFAQSHMEYKLLADPQVQPALSEMVEKTMEILKKNDNGFVLIVEGGRIDSAHHETTAKLALDEAVEFQNAVSVVKNLTNEDDTLIVVTSDHSTVLTVGGYMPRGYNILGPGDYSRSDQMWFFSLSYANGPGYDDHINPSGGRQNPRGKHYLDPKFRQPTTVPEDDETHAGEDVGVYANGPFSHIFTGVYEQNYIAHAIMYAACIGPDEFLKNPQCHNNTAKNNKFSFLIFILSFITSINWII